MHFWINKSQGCAVNGRYVPPYISAGSRRNFLGGGIHPKPMVTPIHRFQSIESVASGHRHHRGPSYHTRFPAVPTTHQNHHQQAIQLNSNEEGAIPRSQRPPRRTSRHVQQLVLEDHNYHEPSLTRVNGPTAKLKCGVWTIIGLIPFLIAAAKYYVNGAQIGIEALMFFALLLFILVVIGVVSLFEALSHKRNSRRGSLPIGSETMEAFQEISRHLPSSPPYSSSPVAAVRHSELPPPPYHIAITLPITHHAQDSPPPTYDKAVT